MIDYVFSFKAIAWRSMYKRREHLTHLRAVQYDHCLVLLMNVRTIVVTDRLPCLKDNSGDNRRFSHCQ